MKKHLAIIALFLIITATYSQDYKFGKVSIAELEEIKNVNDASANAAVLYKKQSISFQYSQGNGFQQINEVHERIKIYNKDGFDWATKKIRLFNRSSSSSEELNSLRGYTYNLDNGKIIKDKLKGEGKFEEEANRFWKNSSFTMPNIKEGSVIEYTYKIVSPNLYVDDVDFQYTIPINRFEFKMQTPEYYVYNKLLNPKAAYNPQINTSEGRGSLTIRSKSRSGGNLRSNTKTNFSENKIDFKKNIISSDSDNIPALKNEPYVDNLDNYRAKLILELTSVQFPNRPFKNYATDWDKVTQRIYQNTDFGAQLDKKDYYEDDVNTLISGVTDNEKKMNLIFDFVKSKVKWNKYYGYTSDAGVKKAYKESVGNSADINLMLTSMLRHAGLKANPVLVSTKNNGIPLLPTRSGFNYVVCLVEGTQSVFLDATEEYSRPNVLPSRALNWQGRIIRENGSSEWVNLLPNKSSKEITSLNVKIDEDLSISGKVRSQFTDYQALRYRNKFNNVGHEEHIKYLEKDNGELEISNLQVKNRDELSSPVVTSYDYELFDAVEEIGDKLYFSPLLFLANEENPFKQETRNYPIDFQFPIADKYMANIMIPEGYVVESLPKSEGFSFNDTVGKFSYLIKENGKYLQLVINFDINSSFILAEDYPYFKDFYKFLTEKQAEKIVLKKAQP